jgi:hypothetical protein
MSACAMLTYNNVTQGAWQSVKQTVATQYGIQITTDAGTSSAHGFTVHWNYEAGTQILSVQCTDSPFFVRCSTINSEINDKLEACLNQQNIAIARMVPP